MAVFETPHRTTYAFNLHVQDVGHTLILGATGSGKSFLLNFLITHSQKYVPHTVVLDVGHSYRKLSTLLGGRYVEIGLRQHGVTINRGWRGAGYRDVVRQRPASRVEAGR